MEQPINRRRLLQDAVKLATLALAGRKLVRPAEAQTNTPIIEGSSLSLDVLRDQKAAAIASLRKSIPPVKELDYLRAHAQHLEKESTMYIPDASEIKHIMSERISLRDLRDLGSSLAPNTHGLFIYADVVDKKLFQRLYVIKKSQDDSLEFVKGYKVSMAHAGFGNIENSGKTPIGNHKILNGRIGMFGEIVSGLNKYRDLFRRVFYNKADHWFVKEFGLGHGNDQAEVVTDQYLLTGPTTDASRGIRIHGSNRSGALRTDGSWESFLGGAVGSGGCIRMSNVDIRDLHTSGYVLAPEIWVGPQKLKLAATGNAVMIHATKAAQEFNFATATTRPLKWNEKPDAQHQQLPTEVAPQQIQPPQTSPQSSTRPPRWNEVPRGADQPGVRQPSSPESTQPEYPKRTTRPKRWNDPN